MILNVFLIYFTCLINDIGLILSIRLPLEIMALQCWRNQLLLLRSWWKYAWPGLQASRHCYLTVTRQWTRPVWLLVWHSLKCLETPRRMRGQQESQRLNNHWIKSIESAYQASWTNVQDFNYFPSPFEPGFALVWRCMGKSHPLSSWSGNYLCMAG